MFGSEISSDGVHGWGGVVSGIELMFLLLKIVGFEGVGGFRVGEMV